MYTVTNYEDLKRLLKIYAEELAADGMVLVDERRLRKLYTILRDMLTPKTDTRKWFSTRGYADGPGTAYNRLGILNARFRRIVKAGVAYLQRRGERDGA